MPAETCVEAATRLALEHFEQASFRPLHSSQVGNLDYAYGVQEASAAVRTHKGRDSIGGWKVGLTTKRMQDMCGIDTPIAGAIFASTILPNFSPVELHEYVRLGLEMELAVCLDRQLPADRTPTAEIVRDCLRGVCAAFELVDDRNADYTSLDAGSLVADNSWNAGIVLGEFVDASRIGSLLGRAGVLMRGSKCIGRGLTEDAGGDPLAVAAWLASNLRKRGRTLEPGQWVMTGSIVPTHFVKIGEEYSFSIDGFPTVSVAIR